MFAHVLGSELSAICLNSLEAWYMVRSGYSSSRIRNCIDGYDCIPTAIAHSSNSIVFSFSLSSKHDVPVELGRVTSRT